MKKLIAVLLALVMVLCLASCAKKPTATIKIIDLEGTERYVIDVELKDGLTAGVAMEDYFKANNVDYELFDGDMISRIDDMQQDNEAWTVYWGSYVNGEYAQVGLWDQTMAEGDVIEVKLEEANW